MKGMNGLDTLGALRSRSRRIVVFYRPTTRATWLNVLRKLRADGYLLKDSGAFERLLEHIRATGQMTLAAPKLTRSSPRYPAGGYLNFEEPRRA